MKKLIVFFMFLSFILVLSIQAKPFIVCDVPASPDEVPASYLLILNTGEEVSTPFPLHYDLQDISPGAYVVTARAVYTLWGTSAPSVPLEFTKPSLIQPVIRLGAE